MIRGYSMEKLVEDLRQVAKDYYNDLVLEKNKHDFIREVTKLIIDVANEI